MALLRPLTSSVSLLQSQPNLSNSLSISQLRVPECWVHCIVSKLHFGACPVWLFVFHFAIPCHASYSYYCTTFGLCPACSIIFFLSSIFILMILPILFPSAGVLSPRNERRGSRLCLLLRNFMPTSAQRPPLNPSVQASHQPHPIPPSRRFPSPNHQLLPPSPLRQYPSDLTSH
jgi:hypothetical protein